MSQENPASPQLCLHCRHDNDLRVKKLIELEQIHAKQRGTATNEYQFQRFELHYQEQRNFLMNYPPCLHCSQAKVQGDNVINCPACSSFQLELKEKDYVKNCPACRSFQQELKEKDLANKKLEQKCEELRCEADINKKKLEDFKERMSIEASAEMGGSSDMFEDINNPCRESELRKRYEMLKINMWPKCLQKMKENLKKRRGETADERKEKETVERMIKMVFDKASTDMKKKKDSLQTVFKISDKANHVNNKKQLKCMDMAVQNLQMMILYENITRYQDINEELGNYKPDYLCELADYCYKQGCLMALHNPPLTLDWNNKEKHCGWPFPPIKFE